MSGKKKAAAPPGNPYDLNKVAKDKGSQVHHAPAGLTPEQLEARLADYIEVPRQYWDRLRRGEHIMYLRNEEAGGEMRAGGYVLLNPFSVTDSATGEPIDLFKLQNRLNNPKAQGYATWSAAYRDIARVYVRASVAELTILMRLREVESGIRRLAAYAADTRASVAAAGIAIEKKAMKRVTGGTG